MRRQPVNQNEPVVDGGELPFREPQVHLADHEDQPALEALGAAREETARAELYGLIS